MRTPVATWTVKSAPRRGGDVGDGDELNVKDGARQTGGSGRGIGELAGRAGRCHADSTPVGAR
ncbi:hypothetical protein [Streptomyces olivochromogenes]|uniref:hypothetical protein n=1 Tax=Streptomyces olivochromogenes TaxID=1963 RepID=UPI00368A8ED8